MLFSGGDRVTRGPVPLPCVRVTPSLRCVCETCHPVLLSCSSIARNDALAERLSQRLQYAPLMPRFDVCVCFLRIFCGFVFGQKYEKKLCRSEPIACFSVKRKKFVSGSCGCPLSDCLILRWCWHPCTPVDVLRPLSAFREQDGMSVSGLPSTDYGLSSGDERVWLARGHPT